MASGLAASADTPPLAVSLGPLFLTDTEAPAGFVPDHAFSGQLTTERLGPLGIDPGTFERGTRAGEVRSWRTPATLGWRSLIARFSPNRFDSFEEITARSLSAVGPVVAINPPGMTLPPLGAARATMSDVDWQSRIDEWMKQGALVVIAVPPFALTAGLL
ncbi:hypothetical protein I6A60_26695 [Frankia sp. AgB1.9]|uniref:hypothetical protein n=1 Tax=unclassified Frankia TaxID=2632575 RepID=UPI0019320A7C|nr:MULTISPECIES: hypothetical protein [unclassified Frankia]MBL7551420.1 hypothetical protein [Frankia sp. AgB1.9]